MSDTQLQRAAGTTGVTLTRHNPPGLGALRYRGGRYTPALQRMLATLPTQRGGDGAAPLGALNRDIHDDWAIALVHAWAVVTEVLGFYQERIINEGYLRTATEYRSVLELARTIGYELRSGVAASAHLAFTVLSTKDEPARQVFLPSGIAVQSVPPQGRLPQIFETDAAFTARAEWNAIRPELAQSGPIPEVRADSTGLRLAGVSAGVQPGDTLLLLADQPPGAAELPAWLLAEVRAVAPDPQRGLTALRWAILPGIGTAGAVLSRARVFSLRAPIALFGYSRGGVYMLDRASGRWAPAALGMPALTVRAVAPDPTGALLAAADQGIFRSIDGGASWQSAGAGLARRTFHALALAEGGLAYAGGDGGAVFLSADGGTSWTAMAGEVPPPPARGGAGPLPRTVVRALAAYRQSGQDWLAAGTDDGVLRSADRGRTWTPANDALPKVDPKTGLAPIAVRALAVVRCGDAAELFAGTDAGVYRIAAPRSMASVVALPAIAALLVLLLFGPLKLLGALYTFVAPVLNRLIDTANATAAKSASLAQQAGQTVKAPTLPYDRLPVSLDVFYRWLADQITALPLVGTLLKNIFTIDQFIFITDLLLLLLAILIILALFGLAKQALIRDKAVSLGLPVRALADGPDGRLYAGTEQGLFCSNDGDEQVGAYLDQVGRKLTRALFGDAARFWRPVADQIMATANVTSLSTTAAGELLAGLAGGRALRSADGGATWVDLGAAPLKTTLALMSLGDGYLAAGAPLDEPLERGWSREARRGGLLDLAQPAPELAAGMLVLLRQPSGPQPAPSPRLYRIASAAPLDSRDPARPARITRVAVEPFAGLADFDRLSLEVLALGPELSCYDDRPVAGTSLVCAGPLPGLAPGHILAISGRRVRASAPPGARLCSLDGLRSDPIGPDESLVVLAAPIDCADDEQEWRVRTRAGVIGLLCCPRGALRLEPAREGDEIVSELAELSAATHHDSRVTLTFNRPLANVYDRSSVVIAGNLVPASHGVTVQGELLGSSDAMSLNQRFLLKQPPLTYVATPTGVANTLTLTVNGVRWTEVPFLHNRARDQRVYMLRQDATSGEPHIPAAPPEGGSLTATPPSFPASEVIFGDGVSGAGLPTGTWKIEATYRSGIGSLGNLPAGSLSVLQSAPRGIKAVTNPLPTGGGVDPETFDTARTQAPLGLRAMDRIVALADYEDFAHAYPGVRKARTTLIARGRQRLIHLTIADAEAGTGADAAFVDALAGAIASQRAAPTPPLYVDRCEMCYFHLRARLLAERGYVDSTAAIGAKARRALAGAFGFAQREIGQSVAESDIIRVLQAIEGVAAVELYALYISGAAVVNRLLVALPARLEGDRIRPAQLLLLNTTADEGVMLEIQV
jgi:photosystem II stability/assembly factor-like uncharacterized protein